MRPRSLYVHVPFCARRCFYCDFAVEANRRPPVTEWVEAIAAELRLLRQDRAWAEPLAIDTLYVGGGTPSLLGEGALQAMAAALAPHAALAGGAEWTCEANPETFTPALAEDWRGTGVNRVSIGVQSFDAGALRWMGRLHGPIGAERAVGAARDAGLTDISVDLIFGLPSKLQRDWAADIDQALALDPTHISLYGLTAEAGAPLGRRVREGREELADDDRYAEEYLLAHDRLSAEGFEHYEVSNFARPGHRSRHNAAYWTGAPYAALGPGAHAFYPPLRRWNLRSWTAYRDAVRAGGLPIEDAETLDGDAVALEAIWLGLRTDVGLSKLELTADQVDVAAGWERDGLARVEDERVRLTPSGWLLLDQLAVQLGAAAPARSKRGLESRIDAHAPLVQISTS